MELKTKILIHSVLKEYEFSHSGFCPECKESFKKVIRPIVKLKKRLN